MKQHTSFPNLIDSLGLYKEAILNSMYNEDLETAAINFSRLIAVLEYHNQKEKRLNAALEEAKKRYLLFQNISDSDTKTKNSISKIKI
ncbi:MAG: hypothetical protein P1P88_05875 [Bacteroidales bacterium]|nr:hypothetical protein [Bacteroidales bacterium]